MTHLGNQVIGSGLWGTGGARSERVGPETPAIERQANGHRLRAITRAIEVEIVPRLVMAHSAQVRQELVPVMAREPLVSDQVKRLAQLVLGQDVAGACAHVERLREHGRPLEAIYLDVLAPTARHLQSLWKTDVCDFAEVTLALWRLQEVLREFSLAFRSEFDHREHGTRILLAPGPGEEQELGYVMFGLAMTAEFFRRAGWDAWLESDTASEEFCSLFSRQSFDVVEFMVSGSRQLDALASVIRSVRRNSLNRAVGVMVCGPAFNENPELVLMVGADALASDPGQGALQAQKLVGLLASRG